MSHGRKQPIKAGNVVSAMTCLLGLAESLIGRTAAGSEGTAIELITLSKKYTNLIVLERVER